jgi:predicted anti-sigma-YlaC factor YlaD
MHALPETISPDVLSESAEIAHPTERALGRFAANEMGSQRKKMVTRHLENCAECRNAVSRLHEIARRFRDLERRAIAHVAVQVGR